MKIYNIAYTPKFDMATFYALASNCENPQGYLLSSESSIPHVTICQFSFEESLINSLCDDLKAENFEIAQELTFEKYSNLTFDGKIYWMSLIPTNTDILIRSFEIASRYVKRIRTDDYDPHLTLFNYKIGQNVSMPEDIFPISEEFELVVGESDEMGQMTKIVASFTPQISLNSRF